MTSINCSRPPARQVLAAPGPEATPADGPGPSHSERAVHTLLRLSPRRSSQSPRLGL